MQEDLRKQVKVLKALQNVSYKEIAKRLEMNNHSFYNWLSGYYEFSEKTEQKLIEILSSIIEKDVANESNKN